MRVSRISLLFVAPALLLFSLGTIGPRIAAQATQPQISATSNGACDKPAPLPANQPDMLSTIYVPAKPDTNAVTAPRLIYSVGPQFPSDVPKGPFSGVTKVALLVDTDGKPQQVHVEQSLGPDFDKTAVAAVEQYRFRPARRYGKPVQVKACIEINYRKY